MLRSVDVGTTRIDFVSDLHLPPDTSETHGRIAKNIATESKGEILAILGDVVDARNGQDVSALVDAFWDEASPPKKNQTCIYVPGNHDLRGRENMWESFSCRDRVHMTNGKDPVELDIHGTRILIGDIFYDLKLFDGSILGLTRNDVEEFYQTINDGRHLRVPLLSFPDFSTRFRDAVSPEFDVIMTHALPHPSLVTCKVPRITPEMEEYEHNLRLRYFFRAAGPDDRREAQEGETTLSEHLRGWNCKSLVMGSDVLSDADVKNDCVWLYGHNHRSGDRFQYTRKGDRVRLISNQIKC